MSSHAYAMPIVVKTEGLTKEYQLGEVLVPALQGVSLELEKGEFAAVLGPSGSGKTTFLNIVGTLDEPTSGKVYIDGEDLTDLSERELTRLRRKKIGFIFQFYNLIPVLTALENVELPMIIAGVSRKDTTKRAQTLLETTGLLNRAAHRTDELSGGEQQRVAIARALANRPSIILADEPTGDLDSATGKQVMKMLFEMSRQEKTTVIVATHDPAVISMADRLLRMRDGRITDDEKKTGHKGA
jgi:putative ABC transport system ATP-binding protein